MKTTICVLSLLLIGVSVPVSAQASISIGGNASGSSGNASYSIGQTFYETMTSTSGSVSDGVQQPFEITATLGSEITEINLNFKIYPNPTPDILYLKVGFVDYKKYRYELYDSSGKVLIDNAVRESQVSIAMASYPAAIYYLKIIKDNKVVKIFKVLKTDK